MKFNQIIIVSGIISLLLLQNVSATPNPSLKRKQPLRTKIITKVQDDIDRLQNRENQYNQKKQLNKNYANSIDDFGTGRIKIDTKKKGLNAKIVTREGEENKNPHSNKIREQNLSKIEMESIATELNIEYRLKQLKQDNDKIN